VQPQIQTQPVRICRTNEVDAWTKLSIVLGLPSDGSPKEAANALMETLNTSGPSQHLIASLHAVIDFAKITKKAYELQLVKSTKAANDGFHAKVLKIVHDRDAADADVVIKGTELILEVAKQQLATGKKLTDDERKELATKAGLMAQMQNLEFATAVKERAFKSVLKLSKIEKEVLAQHVSDFEKEAKISACEASFRHFIYN
jgi:hypothetical protein